MCLYRYVAMMEASTMIFSNFCRKRVKFQVDILKNSAYNIIVSKRYDKDNRSHYPTTYKNKNKLKQEN